MINVWEKMVVPFQKRLKAQVSVDCTSNFKCEVQKFSNQNWWKITPIKIAYLSIYEMKFNGWLGTSIAYHMHHPNKNCSLRICHFQSIIKGDSWYMNVNNKYNLGFCCCCFSFDHYFYCYILMVIINVYFTLFSHHIP